MNIPKEPERELTASEALQIADRFFPVDTKEDDAELQRFADQGVKQ